MGHKDHGPLLGGKAPKHRGSGRILRALRRGPLPGLVALAALVCATQALLGWPLPLGLRHAARTGPAAAAGGAAHELPGQQHSRGPEVDTGGLRDRMQQRVGRLQQREQPLRAEAAQEPEAQVPAAQYHAALERARHMAEAAGAAAHAAHAAHAAVPAVDLGPLPPPTFSPTWKEDAANYRLTVVTGASGSYFWGLMNLVGSIHFWCPQCRIVIFNLGLNEQHMELLNRWCNVEVEWNDKQSTSAELKKYAWKPQAILQAVDKYHVIFWMDAGSTLTGPLDDFQRELRRDGIWAVQGQDDSVTKLGHPAAFKYFGFEKAPFEGHPSFAGNTWGFVKGSPWIDAVVVPWERCSRDPACISPPGSALNNHRYDQTVISIIIYTNATVYEPDGKLQSARICKTPTGACPGDAPGPGLEVTHHTNRLAANTRALNASGCHKPSFQFVWTARQACTCYRHNATHCEGLAKPGWSRLDEAPAS